MEFCHYGKVGTLQKYMSLWKSGNPGEIYVIMEKWEPWRNICHYGKVGTLEKYMREHQKKCWGVLQTRKQM